MKPYGYNSEDPKCKIWDFEYEDVLSIQIAGRKSSIGKFPEKCGKYKSYLRNTITRNTNRRYWKKRFRNYSKILCQNHIQNLVSQ